jgi:hypothetical protein
MAGILDRETGKIFADLLHDATPVQRLLAILGVAVYETIRDNRKRELLSVFEARVRQLEGKK